MAVDKRNTRAGGFLIAVGAAIGVAIGVALHQPSAGLLVGVGTGAIAALVLYLIDRR